MSGEIRLENEMNLLSQAISLPFRITFGAVNEQPPGDRLNLGWQFNWQVLGRGRCDCIQYRSLVEIRLENEV